MGTENIFKALIGTIKNEGLCECKNPGMGSRILEERRRTENDFYGTTGGFGIRRRSIVPATRDLPQEPSFDPDVWERPLPSVDEFLSSPEFLGSELAPADQPSVGLYDVWKKHLNFVSNSDNHISQVFIEAAIGSGKTTASVCAALYAALRLMLLKNPQRYFGFIPSTRLVIFIASITNDLASNVSFDLLRNMLNNSPVFMNLEKHVTQDLIALPKNVFIEIGSQPRHALGSAIYFALIDEANFGNRSTPQEPGREGQVIELYIQTVRRIESRFRRPDGYVAGQIFIVSSKRATNDALHRLIENERALNIPTSYVIEHSLWEAKASVRGRPSGLYSGAKFRMLIGDRFTEPRVLADGEEALPGTEVIEVPVEHREAFDRDAIGALRDIGNLAVDSTAKLIRNRERLRECISDIRGSFFRTDTIVLDFDGSEEIMDFMDPEFFRNYVSILPGAPEFSLHIDTALCGDALAIAMSHATRTIVPSTDATGQKIDGEKIFYTNDFTIRIKNAPGKVIPLSRVVNFVVFLCYAVNVNLVAISVDSFQSAAIAQPLAEKGVIVKILSVDRDDDPYLRLREIIYEERIDLPQYNPLITELLELNHFPGDRKVDHPLGGSKDCGDALCGSIWNLTQAAVANAQTYGPPIHFPSRKEIEKVMRQRDREGKKEDWGWLVG